MRPRAFCTHSGHLYFIKIFLESLCFTWHRVTPHDRCQSKRGTNLFGASVGPCWTEMQPCTLKSNRKATHSLLWGEATDCMLSRIINNYYNIWSSWSEAFRGTTKSFCIFSINSTVYPLTAGKETCQMFILSAIRCLFSYIAGGNLFSWLVTLTPSTIEASMLTSAQIRFFFPLSSRGIQTRFEAL